MFESSPSPTSASDELVHRLTALQLCRPHDFQRAKGFVRRLVGDLPAFDTVWIDALVQLRQLTPYQARVIEQGAASELRVGPYVLVDNLGRGPRGTTSLAQRPLARTGDRSSRCVVKRFQIDTDDCHETRQRLNSLLERTSGWTHPHLVVPHSLLLLGKQVRDGEQHLDQQAVATVSRFIDGVPLSELLVRRGRFPAKVVLEVGRQLLSGLASLDGRGLVHGDIRLSNVRMTDRGSAVLVDGGLRPAVCPELTIHASFALESYDGVAPELIGTGVAPNASSELYGLGCLLWQLLAGRPPYPMADPLMKLAAHQTRRIEDVREWAPETPAHLAQAIHAMTSPVPEQRPRSFDELLQRWGHPGARSRARVRRFRRAFDGAVPHLAQPAALVTEGRWPWIAASLFLMSGAVLTLANTGMRSELLALTRRVSEVVQRREVIASAEPLANERSASTGAAVLANENGLLLLPPPSADGVVLLAESGPYTVADIAHGGRLTIRGAAGINPVIYIGQEPLRLAAAEVTLANVAFRRDPRVRPARKPESPLAALLLVRTNRMTLEGCEFETDIPSDSITLHASAALAWLPLDAATFESVEFGSADLANARFAIENTVFRGSGAAVVLAETPGVVTFTNCLKLGRGACLTLGHKATARPLTIELSRITLRDSGPLLRFGGAFAEQASAPQIKIIASDCIFSLPLTATRPDTQTSLVTNSPAATSLIEIQTARPRSPLAQSVRWQGRDSVVPPGLELLVLTDPTRGTTVPVANADDQFESLLASEVEFAGPASGANADSRLTHFSAPRSSQAAPLPGFDPTALAEFFREPSKRSSAPTKK